MKKKTLALLLGLLFTLPAFCFDSTKVCGDYTSDEKGFVHCKKISIWKAKDGKTKGHLILAGYPDDVDLGETTFDVYPQRDGSHGDRLIGILASNKMNDLVVVETQPTSNPYLNTPGFINVSSHITYKDGRPNVYFETSMKKQESTGDGK
jgi:hypothetical protein